MYQGNQQNYLCQPPPPGIEPMYNFGGPPPQWSSYGRPAACQPLPSPIPLMQILTTPQPPPPPAFPIGPPQVPTPTAQGPPAGQTPVVATATAAENGQTLEIAVFLFWMACGTSYRVVAASFDLPRSSVHRLVHKILKYILSLLPSIVRLPAEDELAAIGRGFSQSGGRAIFSLRVGAINGCHAVVDNNGLFIDVLSGYPGSVHDSRIFKNSPIFYQRLYPPAGYLIIGDSGYPCRERPITIITPYKEPLNDEKRSFNLAFSRARVVIERPSGMMKVRWRSIFTKALEVNIETSIKVIAACTVMHNTCISQGDVLPEHLNDVIPRPPPPRAPHDEVPGINGTFFE